MRSIVLVSDCARRAETWIISQNVQLVYGLYNRYTGTGGAPFWGGLHNKIERWRCLPEFSFYNTMILLMVTTDISVIPFFENLDFPAPGAWCKIWLMEAAMKIIHWTRIGFACTDRYVRRWAHITSQFPSNICYWLCAVEVQSGRSSRSKIRKWILRCAMYPVLTNMFWIQVIGPRVLSKD